MCMMQPATQNNTALELGRWNDENIFFGFDSYRSVFNQATATIIGDVFSTHLKEHDTVLEVGSGLGYLSRLVPEYADRIQQSDGSAYVVESDKKLNPSSNIIELEGTNLRSVGRSFNSVVGFSSYDVFPDLPAVMRQTRECLDPNGIFIHFLDLQASIHSLFVNEMSRGKLLLPLVDEVRNFRFVSGVKEVDIDTYQNFKRSLAPSKLPVYEIYEKEPHDMFITLSGARYKHILLDMATDVDARIQNKGRVLRFNDYFRGAIRVAAEQSGFRVLRDETLKASSFSGRSKQDNCLPNNNCVENNIGVSISYREERSERPNDIRYESGVLVFIAQKR